MAKKQEKEKRLSAEQYYKWRFAMANMEAEKGNLKEAQLKLHLMEKDLEIARLKAGLYKTTLSSLEAKELQARNEYKDIIAELGKEYDVDLTKCSIDDVTFEINILEP